MIETVWLMDSEFCCECGTFLRPFESVLCTDCLHDAWYDDDQAFYDAWFYDAEEKKTPAELPTQDVSSGAALPADSVRLADGDGEISSRKD